MLRRLCLGHRQILLGLNVMQHAAYSTSIKRNYGDGSGNSQYDLTTYKLPFTSDEQNYLLATVNTITAADLTRLKVTKRIIKQLMKSKAEVGSYAELSELLYINGFGIKAVESLCNALLRDRDGEVEDDGTNIMLHKNFRKRLVKPRVDTAQLEDIRTVVSLHVTAGCLAWAKIDCSGQVEDLSVEELLNSDSRFDAPKIYDKVMDVASRIPDADLYVWEEKNNQQLIRVPLSTIIIAMQLAQIKGMLMVLLESRLKREIMREEVEKEEGAVKRSSGRLIYMKESIVPKLFMLKRGGERTSGLKLADELMGGQQLLSWLPPLDVGEGVQDCYFSTHPSLRRHTATAMFIGLAFNHTIIQQNVDVLRKLITPSV